MSELLWTAILRCSDCKLELNRAVHVPENQRGRVDITDLEWVREDSDRVRGSA